jgi:NADPH:quinone reductase-like Zn-dependent oxidoreductase
MRQNQVTMMKSAARFRYGGYNEIAVVDRAVPECGGDGILVKVHHSAVTAADTFLRSGTPRFARLMLGLFKPKNPFIGTGFSGEVVEVGEGVSSYHKGDFIFGESGLGFAANSEYVLVKDEVIAAKPDFLKSDAAACLCDGALTSYNFLCLVGNLKKGQKVLINGGAGSLGSSAVQLAKALGAEVHATCSLRNFEFLVGLGADKVIDYSGADFKEIRGQYDLIFDTVGKLKIGDAKKMLKKEGHYMSPVLNLSVLIQMLLTRLLKTSKKVSFSATGMMKPNTLKKLISELLKLVDSGSLNLAIERSYSLAEIKSAHKLVDSGHKKGNIVIDMRI